MDALETYKAAQKDRWAKFAPLAVNTTISAARLAAFAGIRPGLRVLDVACGTGVVSVTAARLGARVTGLDLTPELLSAARENAAVAGVEIVWHEGDVEQLPFPEGSFDVVVSQFGHMFAPRAGVAVGEMIRVLTRGGTLAFSTWPPDRFIGEMFAMTARYMPAPPAGVDPPPLWGDPTVVRQRLGAAVRDVVFERSVMTVPALTPAHYRDATERMAGPVTKLVETLAASDPAKLAAFRQEYDALTQRYFSENSVRQDYLMTRATKV